MLEKRQEKCGIASFVAVQRVLMSHRQSYAPCCRHRMMHAYCFIIADNCSRTIAPPFQTATVLLTALV